MLITAFDSNMDGKLSLIDFSRMICPFNYSQTQHNITTKKKYVYALDNSETHLSHDIEHGILRICE
jgi:hypothetical protein